MENDNEVQEIELEGEESLEPDSEYSSTYPYENIKVDKEFYSVYELKRKYDRRKNINSSNFNMEQNKKNQLIIDSDFQRESVWKPKQRSELIESVLMGLPLPIIYLFEDRNGNLIVVDGRQRLTAFFDYLDDNFALGELKILKKERGKKFSNLNPNFQSKLEDFQLIAQVIKPPTPDRIKFDIFDRVNRGGTPLNNQEMRNALYQGKSTVLLKELSLSNEFIRAVDTNQLFKRMKDRYIILRFLAFYLWRNRELVDEKGILVEYKSDIDDFLGKAMECINRLNNNYIENLKALFISAMEKAYRFIGPDAFRLYSENGRRLPINMNVFEIVTFLIARLPTNFKNIDILRNEHKKLLQSYKFKDNIGNHRDSFYKVNERFEMIDNILKEVL
jgi:hypothetical protein